VVVLVLIKWTESQFVQSSYLPGPIVPVHLRKLDALLPVGGRGDVVRVCDARLATRV